MDWSCVLDPQGCVVSWAFGLVEDTFIGQWATYLWQGVGQTLVAIGTLWIGIPTPSLTETYSPTNWIVGALSYVTLAVFIGSLMVAGGTIAWRARKEPVRETGEGIALFAMVTAGGTMVLQVLIEIADEMSGHFLSSANHNPVQFAKNMTGLVFGGANAGTNLAILVLVGIVVLLANIAQIVMMYARGALLMLLAGFLPLMAAVAVSPAGRTWLKKGVGWSVAFILFKPVAAIIYAVAIQLMSSVKTEGGAYSPFVNAASTGDSDAAMGIIMSGALMVICVFALPSLVAFLVPVTAHIGDGGGGGGSGLFMASRAATGAASVAGGARGMSGAKVGGASGSSAAAVSPPGAAVAATKMGVDTVRSGTQNGLSAAMGSGPQTSQSAHGTSGANGANGNSGANGASGSSGANGANGNSGAVGASSAPGVPIQTGAGAVGVPVVQPPGSPQVQGAGHVQPPRVTPPQMPGGSGARF